MCAEVKLLNKENIDVVNSEKCECSHEMKLDKWSNSVSEECYDSQITNNYLDGQI